MYFFGIIILCFLEIFANVSGTKNQIPSWLKLGAGTSAFQVEGGWNASDRSESVWDRTLHLYPWIVEGNCDDAAKSYENWWKDVQMCVELGLHFYRFSISWSRLCPSGFANYISPDGRNYYDNLINALLAKGIEPVVTICHFDIPARLQDLGGWANPLIADWFAAYARVVFSLFGDRVKVWITLNEPLGICDAGYDFQSVPYLNDRKIGMHLCTKNVLMAHAKAYRIYDEEFKPFYGGKVSIVNLFCWLEPATESDRKLTDLALQYWEGRFAHPIFSKEGGWPKELEKVIARNSNAEGYPTSRLPPFTQEEIDLIKGTYDFYGLNHYTTRWVRKAKLGEQLGQIPINAIEELGAVLQGNPAYPKADVDWFTLYPEGLRRQLNWLKATYNVSEYMIMEHGFLSTDPSLNDYRTVDYIKDSLEQILCAIEDGVNVTAYSHWSLMDTFERGYCWKFGLYHVDFSDPKRPRKARESSRYYSRVTRTRNLRPPGYKFHTN